MFNDNEEIQHQQQQTTTNMKYEIKKKMFARRSKKKMRKERIKVKAFQHAISFLHQSLLDEHIM